MSRAIEAGEAKALVRALVKAAGGVEAAAVELGISAERVSQYQRPTCPDQMPFLCICKLEAVVCRPIVTGAAARAVEGSPENSLSHLVVEAVGASAAALQTITAMDSDGRRDAGEIRNTQQVTQRLLREVEALADAAGRLEPGAVG